MGPSSAQGDGQVDLDRPDVFILVRQQQDLMTREATLRREAAELVARSAGLRRMADSVHYDLELVNLRLRRLCCEARPDAAGGPQGTVSGRTAEGPDEAPKRRRKD